MGKKYSHLSIEERCSVARGLDAGRTLRQIAADLGRSASSISREIKRNRGSKVGYQPTYADEQAWARRWSGSRLERDTALQTLVLEQLARGWSPEEVVGRLKLTLGKSPVSHETIYRFIYAQIRRTDNFAWRLYLPRAKSKRGYRKRKGGSPVDHIKDRVSITRRPAYILKRRQPGHWEADYILFKRYGQAILVAEERSSRFILLAKPPSRKAETTRDQLATWFRKLPPKLRRTLTQDNGTEFALHYQLRDQLGIETYFCDPHSPWQKGGIENANGRLRRDLPSKTDLAELSDQDIQDIASRYNQTPRKCLGFKTPAEVLSRQLLHFKCESTS